MNSQPSYTLKALADLLDLELVGDANKRITGLATLPSADAGQLSFCTNKRYRKFLGTTKAGCVLLHSADKKLFAGNSLYADDPYLVYARLTGLFAGDAGRKTSTVHPGATIAADAQLGDNVFIGANVVIESGCVIGPGTQIHPGCYIGENVTIGADTVVYANVSIYHQVSIGDQCILHSGCVVGADGFGFAPSDEGWQKIHQLGGVEIGDQVEIGANTCIDRGALDDTVIGSGVKIDNLVQVAHNVRIGDNTAIAAFVGISGSTLIGRNCTIAGAVGIVGHLNITDNVHLTGMSMVTKSITRPGSYSSGTGLSETRQWRKNAVRFNQLDSIVRKLQSTSN